MPAFWPTNEVPHFVRNDKGEIFDVALPGWRDTFGLARLATDASGKTVLLVPDGKINIRTPPQTAVIFGDSGWHYGWATGRPFMCINEAGTKAAGVLATALSASAENLCFVGNASPISLNGIHTIETKQTGAVATNITAITAHTDGRVKVTSTSHGLTAGHVAIIASVSGTGMIATDVTNRGHFVREVIDANNITLGGLNFSGVYVSGGTLQKGHGIIWPYSGNYLKTGSLISGLEAVVTFQHNRVTDRSAWHVMQAILANPFEVLNYAAVNSQDTANMEERLQRDVLDYNPGWCFVHAGANNVRVLSDTPENAAVDTQALLARMLSANIRVVYVEWFPDNSSDTVYDSGNTNKKSKRHSRLMREWCRENGVIFVSQWESLSDPTSATGDAPAQKLFTDGVHLSGPGAQLVGRALADAVGPYVTGFRQLLPNSTIDSYAADTSSNQYFANPILATATGGTVGAGGSGTAASGVSIARSASGTFVASVEARTVAVDGDAIGNNQKVVWTPSSATEELYIKFLCTAGNFAAGDIIEGALMMSVDADAAGNKLSLAGAYTIVNNFAHYAQHLGGDGTSGNAYLLSNITNLQMVVPRLKIPTGTTITEVGVWAIVKPATGWTAGAITITAGRVAVRKVDDLGMCC